MRHAYLHRGGNDRLIVFFAGWGGEPALFDMPRDAGWDCLVCYDYSTLGFDHTLLEGYREKRLLAWSMGVWAASQTFAGGDAAFSMRISVAGSETPVDDARGIPADIFAGTLANLSPVTLAKFRRRMCGSADSVRQFLAHDLHRTVDDLRSELAAIGGMVASRPACHIDWDKSIIATRDGIFPPANLRRAWQGTPTVEIDTCHYDAALFAALLGGKEEMWTKT